MGVLEQSVKKELRRSKVNKAVITTVATAGVIAAALVAPNVVGAMVRLGLINSAQKRQTVQNSFTKLVARGYIRIDGGKARLTEKGEKFAALIGEGKLKPKKPKKWDHKWRVLIFDIPEHRKKTRDQVRRTLVTIGFKRLQDSVWVYPYDCEDLLVLLKADLRIGKDLLYMIVDRIEYDAPLRIHFGL